MSVDSQVKIGKEYSDTVNAAIVAHEKEVAGANAQLAIDLEATDDPAERAEILAAFDREIAPVRNAYHQAVEEADAKRNRALGKLKPTEGEAP